jgi:hypothetical protein
MKLIWIRVASNVLDVLINYSVMHYQYDYINFKSKKRRFLLPTVSSRTISRFFFYCAYVMAVKRRMFLFTTEATTFAHIRLQTNILLHFHTVMRHSSLFFLFSVDSSFLFLLFYSFLFLRTFIRPVSTYDIIRAR